MLRPDQTDTCHMDSVVKVNHISKEFYQWQKSETGFLKQLFKANKKVITALDDVSFQVKKGEFLAYAGANGAGKSTTMRLLSGMLQPKSGEIEVLGRSPVKDRKSLMKDIGVLFGNRSELWWDHTIMQSFEYKKVIWDIDDERYKRNVDMFTELLGMQEILGTFARELSLGQRMKADLAMMLLHDPQLILMDEPTLGLDVLAKRQMIDFLKQINRERGITIMVTSHDMGDLEEMAGRILLITKGKKAFDGTFEELRKFTNSAKRVSVYFKRGMAGEIKGMRTVSKHESMWEYEFDEESFTMQDVLARLSVVEGIQDIEIQKQSIEELIAKLYKEWTDSEAV